MSASEEFCLSRAIQMFALLLLLYHFSDYYFVCVIGGEHDGICPSGCLAL